VRQRAEVRAEVHHARAPARSSAGASACVSSIGPAALVLNASVRSCCFRRAERSPFGETPALLISRSIESASVAASRANSATSRP
jgi:hypothetical protein